MHIIARSDFYCKFGTIKFYSLIIKLVLPNKWMSYEHLTKRILYFTKEIKYYDNTI